MHKEEKQLENQDFKYVLQDMTNLYFGAKLTYQELMDSDQVPFKLKTIFAHYMLKEVAPDTKIEDHIFYLKDTDLSYMIYKQLKARFRLNVWKTPEDGVKEAGYKSKEYRIWEIVGNRELIEKKDIILVEELHITKLALLSVSV